MANQLSTKNHARNAVSNRVNAGDRLAFQELREALDKYTWMSSVMGGNLAYQAETSLVNATVRRLTLPIRVDVNLATMVNTNLR